MATAGLATRLGPPDSDVLVVDSVTRLGSDGTGSVVVAGSHGGVFAAALAARCGVRAIVLHDAGGGLEGAGHAGLGLLERLGVPAVTVDSRTARIGDGRDTYEAGLLSHVNSPAHELGCRSGDRVSDAVARLQNARAQQHTAQDVTEARYQILPGESRIEVWALDSVSLTTPDDDGDILLTGSHGNLLGGDPASAVKSTPILVVYNDAGGVREAYGWSRLAALDRRRIAGATVAAASARIGDGRSTYNDGRVSHVNACAEALGGRMGMTARDLVDRVLAQVQETT